MKQREFTEAEVDAVIERFERLSVKIGRDTVDHRKTTVPETKTTVLGPSYPTIPSASDMRQRIRKLTANKKESK